MRDNNIQDNTEELTNFVENINELALQRASEFQSDPNKTDYIRWGVNQFSDWSKITKNITEQRCTYKVFASALQESMEHLNQFWKLSGAPFPQKEIVISDDEGVSTYVMRYSRKPLHIYRKNIKGYNSRSKPSTSSRLSKKTFEGTVRRGECVFYGKQCNKHDRCGDDAALRHI